MSSEMAPRSAPPTPGAGSKAPPTPGAGSKAPATPSARSKGPSLPSSRKPCLQPPGILLPQQLADPSGTRRRGDVDTKKADDETDKKRRRKEKKEDKKRLAAAPTYYPLAKKGDDPDGSEGDDFGSGSFGFTVLQQLG